MSGKQKPPASISLVLIVRNEAQNVQQLLNELDPVIDEAIVVDTGSTDDTVAQAANAGARVLNFPWCDDFSAARNYGLDAATKGWVLTIDADERIAPSDFAALKSTVQLGQPQGCFFVQRNYTDLLNHPEWRPNNGRFPGLESNSKGFIVAHQIRLFPNLPELRYHGCIHETVGGFEKIGLEKNHIDLTIHHYGHMRTGETAARRNELYSRLTRKKLRSNPQDGDACYQMAVRYMEEGQPRKARQYFEQLASHGPVDHPATTRGLIALGRIMKNSGDPEAALAAFESAVQQKPEWLLCWIETITILIDADQWSDVARYLDGARMIFPDEALLLRFECRLLIATGSFAEAADKAGLLVLEYPNWPGAKQLADLCQKLVKKEH